MKIVRVGEEDYNIPDELEAKDMLTQIVNLIIYQKMELGQLYGVAINLMIEAGKNEIFFSHDDMAFARDYTLVMRPDEPDKLNIHVSLVKNE